LKKYSPQQIDLGDEPPSKSNDFGWLKYHVLTQQELTELNENDESTKIDKNWDVYIIIYDRYIIIIIAQARVQKDPFFIIVIVLVSFYLILQTEFY
jgi:hypothetical protein